MKVLHIITSLYTGGAERLMVDLLPLLQQNGSIQVDLLLFNGVETPLKDMIEEKGIKVSALSTTNDVYSLRKLFSLKSYLSHEKYDIIHTHNTACQLFAPIAQKMICGNTPLVTTEHSSNSRRRTKWWCKPLDKWMYNQYSAIICIADKARKNLYEYIGRRDNVYTISNGVNTQTFIRPIKDITSQTSFIITMVAAMRPEKDHATLLRAMTHLPAKYKLRFVGSGPKEHLLMVEDLANELELGDRVSFLGLRQDVSDILEQSDINVLSSHWEGLSLSSIEGMASGRPFIASDVDGLREMVGGAGVLFPHGDDKELARQIQHLCENPDEYRQVAMRCQEKAKQFDISVTAQKYLELYHELVK